MYVRRGVIPCIECYGAVLCKMCKMCYVSQFLILRQLEMGCLYSWLPRYQLGQ